MDQIIIGIGIGLILASIPGYWFKKRFQIDGHEIIAKNNLFGREVISVDKKTVVSGFSFFGKIYEFDIDGTNYEVEFSLKRHFLGVGIIFRRSGYLIYSDSWIKPSKKMGSTQRQNAPASRRK